MVKNKDIDIPVIKAFIHNDNYFIYDAYKNQILRISREHYIEIQKMLRLGVSKYKDSFICAEKTKINKDILFLIEDGYFKPQICKKILHPETNRLKLLTERCLTSLVLQITQDCNFSCRYCQYAQNNQMSRSHTNSMMSWNVAKRAIDFFAQRTCDVESLNIAFAGGEPLLNIGLISMAVNYVDSLYLTKNINYYMTTNGSLLNKDNIEFIVKNKFNLMISFDGPSELQNYNRKYSANGNQTYDSVKNNIRFLRDYDNEYFDKYVTFNAVMLDDNNEDIIKDFFEKEGIDKVKVRCVTANLSGVDYIKGYNKDYENQLSKHDEYLNSSIYEEKLKCYENKFSIPDIWHHNGPCIPGMSRLCVNTNGNFYPCERTLENDSILIGNIEHGFDYTAIEKILNVGMLTEEKCKNCWAFRFCKICVSQCINPETNRIDINTKLNACSLQEKNAMDFLLAYVFKNNI